MTDDKSIREEALALSCRELVELVTEYDEHALDQERRRQFEAHLARCVGCKHHVDQMHEASRFAHKLESPEVSPETRARLMALFREWKRTRND